MKNLLFLLLAFLPLQLEADDILSLRGENLVYQVNAILIGHWHAGDAEFSFLQNDSLCQITYHGKTNSLGDRFKKINKLGVTELDTLTLQPRIFLDTDSTKDPPEVASWIFNNGYVKYSNVDSYAVIVNRNNTLDLLTSLNYFRMEVLPSWTAKVAGDSLVMSVVKAYEIAEVTIYYLGKKIIKVNGFKIETEEFDIKLGDLGKTFFGSESNLVVYFSADSYHIPIRLKTKIRDLMNLPIEAVLDISKSDFPYDFPTPLSD